MTTLASHITRWREKPSSMVRELFGVEPDAWQVDALDDPAQRMALKASKGPGKAQPVDTLIPTPSGYRRLGDIVVGDHVFALDGSVTIVTAVHERGNLPVYRVAFDDTSSTLACREHLWRVRGQAERARQHLVPYRRETHTAEIWSTLTTDQIIARGVRVKNGRWASRQFEIPRQGPAEFPRRRLPVEPYLLGVWLGDGVRLKSAYATKPTPEISVELKRKLVAVYGRIDRLRNAGVLHRYSRQRFVPPEYLVADIDSRRDLVCGLMDTDGGIDADGHMEYSSTSQRLAEDVVYLVRSLGGVAFIKATVKAPFYYDGADKIAGKPCYRVKVRLPFNPFRIEKRKARWVDPNRTASTRRYMTRYIDAIDPAGVAECRCIEVAHPAKCYLTNDFIVTHNSTVLAWRAWNFLLTRPHPKIAATSISADNLSDGLWTEMSKWQQRSELLKQTFTWTKTRIFANDHPETWWMAARSWSRTADKSQQADTLAGLHADYIMFILDESGAIPDSVMAAAEAALSTGIEGRILQAGNPTMLSGPLYRACSSERRLWRVIEISGDPDDPKRSPRVSLQWAREQIEKYGRDNPWVMVNVLGKFPPSSLNSLIGPDEVSDAMKRAYRPDQIGPAAPLVFGVDVARYGDDQSVIFPRRGIQGLAPWRGRNIDSTQGAGRVARMWEDQQADAVFIDNTGGFGAGWIDQLALLGKSPVGVAFSARPHNPARFANKRTEMYFDAVQWIKDGGALPPGAMELSAALTQTTYTFHHDRLLLEPKDDIKVKLGYSPDDADAFVLTFAEPVARLSQTIGERVRHQVSYDPFAEMDKSHRDTYSSTYDPYGNR